MSEAAPRSIAISDAKVKRHAAAITTAKQKADDASTAHASAWDKFEKDGGNKVALKAVLKLRDQDVAKSRDFQFHFSFYADTLGLTDQMDAFDQIEADDQDMHDAGKQNGSAAAEDQPSA